MTQEEKLEEAKRLYETANADQRYVLESLFPELAESEDEKMIQYFKDLAPFDKAEELYEKYGFSHKDAIAWLEQQCEQKPSEDEDREYACQSSEHYTRRELMIYNLGIADGKRMIEDAIKETEQKPAWSEEDELKIDFISKLILGLDQEKYDSQCMKELADWLKSLKDRVQPKQAWNEEVEAAISLLKDIAEEQEKDYCPYNASNLRKAAQYLETCRPQNKWKPSEKQIISLYNSIPNAAFCERETLTQLYVDLKKLMEDKL